MSNIKVASNDLAVDWNTGSGYCGRIDVSDWGDGAFMNR